MNAVLTSTCLETPARPTDAPSCVFYEIRCRAPPRRGSGFPSRQMWNDGTSRSVCAALRVRLHEGLMPPVFLRQIYARQSPHSHFTFYVIWHWHSECNHILWKPSFIIKIQESWKNKNRGKKTHHPSSVHHPKCFFPAVCPSWIDVGSSFLTYNCTIICFSAGFRPLMRLSSGSSSE